MSSESYSSSSGNGGSFKRGHRSKFSNIIIESRKDDFDRGEDNESQDYSRSNPSSEIKSGSISRLDTNQKDTKVDKSTLNSLDLDRPFPVGRPRQFYSVFMKNIQLQIHAWPSLIAIFTMDIILVCLVGIIYLTEDAGNTPGFTNYSPTSSSAGISPNGAGLGNGLTWISPGTSVNSERLYTDEFGTCTRSHYVSTGMISKIDLPHIYAGINQDETRDQLSMRYIRGMDDGSYRFYPSFEHDPTLDSITQIQDAIEKTNEIIFNQVSTHRDKGGVYSPDKFDDVYGFTLLINRIDNSASVSYTDRMNIRHKYMSVLDYVIQVPQASLQLYNLQPYAILNTVQDMLATAAFRYNLSDQVGDDAKLNKNLEYVIITTTWGNLPSYGFKSADTNMSEQLGLFVFPLIFLCASTLFASSISYERGNQLNALQEMLGLTTFNKVFGFFVFQLIFEVAIGIIFIGLAYVFGLRFAFVTNFLYLFLVIVLAAVVVPATSYFISSISSSQKLILLISIVLLVVEIFVFLTVGGDLRSSESNAEDPFDVTNSLWWNVWPAFGLLAALSEISESVMSPDRQSLDSASLPFASLYDSEGRVRFNVARATRVVEDFLISIPVSLLWMLIGIYMENVLPKRFGVKKPLLYPFSGVVRRAWQVERKMGIVAEEKDKQNPVTEDKEGMEVESGHEEGVSQLDAASPLTTKIKTHQDSVEENEGNMSSDSELEVGKSVKINEGLTNTERAALEAYNTNLSIKRVLHSLKIYFKYFKEIKAVKEEEKRYRELIFSGDRNKEMDEEVSKGPPAAVIRCDAPVDPIIGINNDNNNTNNGNVDATAGVDGEGGAVGDADSESGRIGVGNIFEDSDVKKEIHFARANISPIGRTVLVNFQNMKKIYKSKHKGIPDKVAVNELFLTISESECLGMLGPNGAGKTTAVSMLCGMFAPTSGTAFVCGYDILDPGTKSLIQRQLGVCPQFDIVWGTMTVEEHLRFYSRLKGIPRESEYQHVKDLLEAVGLTVKMNVPAAALSGGMLRRLSVAIALAGRPKILVMDEPTTGLDPSARRSLWNIILSSRKRRAILLTTHSMEEAESLCNRVGVMAAGQLRCIGTHTHLKSKYGSGVKITVTVWSPRIDEEGGFEQRKGSKVVKGVLLETTNEVAVHDRLVSLIGEDLILSSAYCGQLTYFIVGESEGVAIGLQFETMERLAKDPSLHILDWGVSQTSLESVFMNIVDQVQADKK